MSLVIKRSFLAILIILGLFWYFIYVNIYPEKFKNLEFDNQTIGALNSKLRTIYEYISWKTSEYSWRTKDLYNKKIDPSVTKAKSWITDTIDTTKVKIDTVRKTLSWAENTINKAKVVIEKWKETVSEATEVFNDVEKMSDAIIWTVNTGALR